MIGCSELKFPAGESTCIFEVFLVDVKNKPITNDSFNGIVKMSLNISGEYYSVPVSNIADDSKINAYFTGESIAIVIPASSQKYGEVYYSFLLSGNFKITDSFGAALVDYEAKANKLCNFV